MKSFMPISRRITAWFCPKCGVIQERTFPYIYTLIPLSFRKNRTPICPKCKIKMIKVETF